MLKIKIGQVWEGRSEWGELRITIKNIEIRMAQKLSVTMITFRHLEEDIDRVASQGQFVSMLRETDAFLVRKEERRWDTRV